MNITRMITQYFVICVYSTSYTNIFFIKISISFFSFSASSGLLPCSYKTIASLLFLISLFFYYWLTKVKLCLIWFRCVKIFYKCFGALNINNKAGIFAKIVSIQKLVQPNGSISCPPNDPNIMVDSTTTDDKAASCIMV